jgi:hypothetical protein
LALTELVKGSYRNVRVPKEQNDPMPYQANLSTAFENCSMDVAVAIAEQTAGVVAKAFVDDVIPTYGVPQVLLSDCGLLRHMQITWDQENRDQANGLDERSRKGLRNYVSADLPKRPLREVRHARTQHYAPRASS